MAKTIELTQIHFKEMKAAVPILFAETNADYRKTMDILSHNGLRPLTTQEALVNLNQSPELKEQLKGKWFYLDGKGSELSGYFTFNDKGELAKGKGDIEKTVYAWSGSQPLSLYVPSDYYARYNERRFNLDAVNGPSYVAPVVLGVRKSEEAASPKIDLALLENFRSAVAKMDAAAEAGVLNPELVRITKDVLRAIE
ncbi:Uncharacterised protein [uncultured archaeon]|nr:Uncharacterised protein [uncultured archaeon]